MITSVNISRVEKRLTYLQVLLRDFFFKKIKSSATKKGKKNYTNDTYTK